MSHRAGNRYLRKSLLIHQYEDELYRGEPLGVRHLAGLTPWNKLL